MRTWTVAQALISDTFTNGQVGVGFLNIRSRGTLLFCMYMYVPTCKMCSWVSTACISIVSKAVK